MYPRNILHFLTIAAMIVASIPVKVHATNCQDLEVIFARGSGEEQNTNISYQSFKNSIEEKLKTTNLKYSFHDLNYPAISVLNNIGVLLGAFFGGGEEKDFGDSVKAGVNELTSIINNSCANTKYILGGYSQGAIVVDKTLKNISSEKIIYAATFGDPKLYLPEGAGAYPDACRKKNLSEYRKYVPDCYAHEGILGGYEPYRDEKYHDKIGTWCNKSDIMCSSHLNINDHTSYANDLIYEDASKIIFDKIAKYYGFKNTISSPHDTAFLIDSTGSMSGLIKKYKAEAIRLATETIKNGGRVALYDYRDLKDPYQVKQHCDFNTCTIELFTEKISQIKTDGGGDTPESLLSSSLHIMKELNWQYGATKSIVVLTDAGFHAPDLDGTTLKDVVDLSLSIDPVNFYIITEPENNSIYNELAFETDGEVVTDLGKLNLLTEKIINRNDSLLSIDLAMPHTESINLEIKYAEQIEDEATIIIETNASKTIVILNDYILGSTDSKTFTIRNLSTDQINNIVLVPVKDDTKGKSTKVTLKPTLVPGVPNTGRR